MTRPTERHGSMPAVQHLSDDELLRLLLGDDADALLSRHSLPDLFALHARPPVVQEHHGSYGACHTLAVAKELLARALRQQVCPGDTYADPAHVRDYLRLRLPAHRRQRAGWPGGQPQNCSPAPRHLQP